MPEPFEIQDNSRKLAIDAFLGGMNTSVDQTEIADNEAVLIENFEYDDSNNLVTRNGVSNGGSAASTKITSIFSFSTDAGFIGNLFTRGTQIRSRPLVLGTDTNLTGALTLPDGTRWYWKSLNNVAVGVNGSTGAGNPIQVVGPAPGTASHLVAAPDGRYIEEHDSRLWIVHASNPNRIQCSDLGSAVNWNTGGFTNPAQGVTIDVYPGDKDQITGLYSWRERLFIFKRKRIYVLRAVSIPNTDPNNWEVVEYSKEIGCIAATTIRETLDDVVFLSEFGLASLTAAEIAADYTAAVISTKMKAVQDIAKNVGETDVFGYTLRDKGQYWLCVSSVFAPNGKNTTYVMDYSQAKAGIIRWTQNDKLGYATSIERHNEPQNQVTYLLGCDDPNSTDFFFGTYKPKQLVKTFADDDLAIDQTILSKGYNFEVDDERKSFLYWYLTLLMLSDLLSLNVKYIINEGEEEGNNPFGLTRDLGSGGLYGIGLYGTALYGDVPPPAIKRIIRKPIANKLKKFVTIQYEIKCNTINQGFTVNKFGMKAGKLSTFKANNV